MSEIVERVTIAIRDALPSHVWGEVSEAVARAAIAAMREPTEAMKTAYVDRCGDCEGAWRSMIDAALK